LIISFVRIFKIKSNIAALHACRLQRTDFFPLQGYVT